MSPMSSDDRAPRDAVLDYWADEASVAKQNTEGASNGTTARPAPRKRRRIVISCTECHRRKQKCDRQLPCTNCTSRNKQSACRYETGAPTAKKQATEASSQAAALRTSSPEREPFANGSRHNSNHSSNSDIPSQVASFGYSHTGPTTLGFLHSIENAHPDEPPLTCLHPDNSTTNGTGTGTGTGTGPDAPSTRERYKTLIRQLPARAYIDKLADIYFSDFNWQYDVLDRDIFDRQLGQWYQLPFGLLSSGGPQALPPDLRAFPALLFQVMAVALLTVPCSDSTFDGLRYAGDMTFEDLAMDYSESGVAILALLGKREMTLTTVLAGFVRGSFLKYVALVTESWHAIGSAIRDAEEIGLHRDSLDPKPASDDAEAVLENQWEIQRRRKAWMTLVEWDVHMACLLGRPTNISLGMVQPSLPVDAPPPKNRSKTPVLPRGENDPPTPLTKSIWAYRVVRPLMEILELEKEGPCPKDFRRVDRLHDELLDLAARTPPCLRPENPDTRFDALPACYWLPMARLVLPQFLSFQLMALHRPYVFTRAKSRTEALKASLDMLHAQRLHFMALKPQMYKTFSLFFGTFDAIVLMASIYILFPKEHPDLVQDALKHFQWAVERFKAMSSRNALAKAALGVLHAIYVRLKRSLGIAGQTARAVPAPSGPRSASASEPSPPSAAPASGSTPSSNGRSAPWDTPGTRTSTSTSTCVTALSAAGDGFSPPQQQTRTPTQTSPSQEEHVSNNSNCNGDDTCCAADDPFASVQPLFSSNSTPNNEATTTTSNPYSNTTTTPGSTNNNNNSSSSSSNGFDFTSMYGTVDWASLQPIYATCDLVYHDLVGKTLAAGWEFDGNAGGGGGDGDGDRDVAWDQSQSQSRGQNQNQNQNHDQNQGQGADVNGGMGVGVGMGMGMGMDLNIGLQTGMCTEGPYSGVCHFEGDFGDDSVWSLLNQYVPI
ncbi:hypothetical protein VTK56DRAFT_7963 [Thermocarpiscus australiensis]